MPIPVWTSLPHWGQTPERGFGLSEPFGVHGELLFCRGQM